MENKNNDKISTYEYQKIQIIKKKLKNFIFRVIILILTICLYRSIEYFFLSKQNIENLEQKKQSLENQIANINSLAKQLENIDDLEKKCLQQPEKCPEYIKNYITIKKYQPKNKMEYDQAAILKDLINISYMNIIYAKINSISFGKPEKEAIGKYTIIKVPLTINILTPNYNSTKNLIFQLENNTKLENLYNIKNLKYDIVKSWQPQNMTLNLEVIYYK